MEKGKKSVSHHDSLIQSLKEPEFAAEYLNNAIEEGDPKYFLKALRNVAESTGSISEVAKRAGLSRMTIYRALSEDGNPEFDSLFDILRSLKIKFTFKAA